jgi:acyl-CoA thioesterase-2
MTNPLVTDLVALLDIETLDIDLYRGPRKPGAKGRVFGGQVIAQGFMAAQGSIDDDKVAHSLHAYFLRPGDETLPIIFRVQRDFDGGSFANRRVIAMQHGIPILTLSASFQRPETGLSHAAPLADVPAPEDLIPLEAWADRLGDGVSETARAFLRRPSAFEVRPVGQPSFVQRGEGPAHGANWFRLRGPVPDGAALHRGILAYVSDYSLLSTAVIPHGHNLFDHAMQPASLDHAIWFHGEVPLDDWLLYSTDSPFAGDGRGFATGKIHARNGRLIASVAQEGLIRLRPDRVPGTTVPHTP